MQMNLSCKRKISSSLHKTQGADTNSNPQIKQTETNKILCKAVKSSSRNAELTFFAKFLSVKLVANLSCLKAFLRDIPSLLSPWRYLLGYMVIKQSQLLNLSPEFSKKTTIGKQSWPESLKVEAKESDNSTLCSTVDR